MLLLLVQTLLAVAMVAVILAYIRFRQKTRLWKKLGVPTPSEISFPLGSSCLITWEGIFGKINLSDAVERQYRQFRDEPYYGTYGPMGAPVLVVNDPELIRRILVKDFGHFVNRQAQDPYANAKSLVDKIWNRQISSLKNEEWKDVRATLTPIFTSGKLRAMLALIDATSDALLKRLDESFVSGKEIDTRDVCGSYTMNTIASCAFGVDSANAGGKDGAKSDENEFVKHASRVFKTDAVEIIKFLVLLTVPKGRKVLEALNVSMAKRTETLFFYDVITQAMRHRAHSGKIGERKDFLDIMLKAVKTTEESEKDKEEEEDNMHRNDQFELDSQISATPHATKHKFDEIDMVASALIVLVAGYDTTATTITYCLYELAKHQDIQDRLVEEIKESLPNGIDGTNLDYNAINGMEYLDMILHETLRLHAPLGILQRECTKDYVLDEKVTLKAGWDIAIPSQGIHLDEKFFPEPRTFNPENFGKSSNNPRSSYTFLAFGQGPRNCMGMRFALLEAKVGIIKMLSKYKIVTTPNTPKVIRPDPKTFLNTPGDKVLLGLEAR